MKGLLELEEKISVSVTALFASYEYADLVYHNFNHTQLVVKHCEEMTDYYQLYDSDRLIVMAAAWFHDTGHLFGKSKGHEELGVKIMQEFLSPAIHNNLLQSIANCIRATEIAAEPTSLPEQVVCDADTYHFGTSDFLVTDELVKKEMVLREHMQTDNWDAKTLDMLQRHQFHTRYCQKKLNAGKTVNITLLQKRLISQK